MAKDFAPDPMPAPEYQAGSDMGRSAARTVKVRHKAGAGGVVHEYGWDFNASDTIDVDRETAELACKKYPDAFEVVHEVGSDLAKSRRDSAPAKE